MNTEGRVQRGFPAVQPPGEAREDWAILRAFSAVLGKPLPYDDLAGVRARLEAVNPVFGQPFFRSSAEAQAGPGGGGSFGTAPFAPFVPDYYMTNAINRASATMAECSRIYSQPALQAAE